MASFRKRGNTWTYYIKVGIDPRTGKYKQKSKGGFKTKKAAQAAAAEMERTFTFEGDRNPTFESLYREWWETHKLQLKPATIQTFDIMYRKHILPYFGKLKIKSIQRHHCQQFIERMAVDRMGTIDTVKAKANQVFNYAVDEGIINSNPMKGIVKPKKSEIELIRDQQKRTYWTREEVNDFLHRSFEHLSLNDHTLFRILLFSGMRKGEALALEWGDINFDKSTIKVYKTIHFEKKETHIQRAKTVSGNRYIGMDDTSMNALRRLYAERTERHEQYHDLDQSNVVFQRTMDARHMRISQPNYLLERLIKKLDMHPITVHGMRHTHASLLFEAGIDIKDVQERLGHSDVKMTLDIYTHVTESKKDNSARLFADFMRDENLGDKLVTLDDYKKKNSQEG